MRVAQYQFSGRDWTLVGGDAGLTPHVVLSFFSANADASQEALRKLRAMFPRAHVAGCTTAGEVLGPRLMSDSVVATAIEFRTSHVHCARQRISDRQSSYKAGQQIGWALQAPDLRGLMILSDGLDTNGTLLVRGLRDVIDDSVAVFGGLAGDGMDFIVTRVAANSELAPGYVAGIGFYGSDLAVRQASADGWTPHGPVGSVTRYGASILYEVDHRPALDWLMALTGLGTASGLPELMKQPLWMTSSGDSDRGVIRSIVGADAMRGCLTLAGEVPGYGSCQLMQANHDLLIDSAAHAARAISGGGNGLGIVVSCVGRRLVLGNRAADEPRAVSEALGRPPLIGFYSYGEIGCGADCATDFHNQTISTTLITESA